jgi:AraC-like DNA-binding protein
MPGSGSSIFTDADGYQATLQGMLDLVVLRPRDFQARLTWVELPNLHLLRAQEASARVACVRLPPQQVFVTFLTQRGPPLIYSGIELKYGDVIMHSRGEHGHQRTTSATRWGSISVTLAALLQFGESVAGYGLVPPASFCLLRPLPAARQQLLRVHSQAGRIAETNLDRLSHKEIVRALEQELILALITCLTTGQVLQDHAVKRDQAAVLLKLEAMLAAQPYKLLHTQDICRTIGVSEHILQASCSSVLGMSADSYQRLLRLKRVRRELTNPSPAGVDSIDVIRRDGFANLHRFIAEYWDAYGEMPPIPPRDSVKH